MVKKAVEVTEHLREGLRERLGVVDEGGNTHVGLDQFRGRFFPTAVEVGQVDAKAVARVRGQFDSGMNRAHIPGKVRVGIAGNHRAARDHELDLRGGRAVTSKNQGIKNDIALPPVSRMSQWLQQRVGQLAVAAPIEPGLSVIGQRDEGELSGHGGKGAFPDFYGVDVNGVQDIHRPAANRPGQTRLVGIAHGGGGRTVLAALVGGGDGNRLRIDGGRNPGQAQAHGPRRPRQGAGFFVGGDALGLDIGQALDRRGHRLRAAKEEAHDCISR